MNRSVTFGNVKLSIPGRIMRVVRMVLQFPGHVLNLLAFRAQQILLGSPFTKLVCPSSLSTCILPSAILFPPSEP